MNQEQRERMMALSSNNVSDALTALQLKGSTFGVRPIWEGCPKIVGEAITVKMGPAGFTTAETTHLGVLNAMRSGKPGSVVVIDHGGRLDVSAFGGIMANTAQVSGMSGVVVDGVTRDIDEYVQIEFPVYSRGAVVATSRGKTINYAINNMIQFAGVQVIPGDIVIADRSGVVIVPQINFEEVLTKAEELRDKEDQMIAEIRAGSDAQAVDHKFNYENMLHAEKGE